jgi:hypothetical protein
MKYILKSTKNKIDMKYHLFNSERNRRIESENKKINPGKFGTKKPSINHQLAPADLQGRVAENKNGIRNKN